MTETSAQWARVKDVFGTAVELPPGERASAVSELCGGDPSLEREVMRLLSLADRAGSFLENPAVPADALPPEESLSPDDRLSDRYRIVELIGRGGMGEVYEAIDEVMGERIAVKVLQPGAEPPDVAAARWRREVQLARRVSHTGVCRVHDVGIHQQNSHQIVFLTMERLHGESLQARLDRGDIGCDEAVELARQVGDALDASHRQGVLHRDIKPQNIVLEPRPNGAVRTVLTDFGLAREVARTDAGVTRTGWMTGTPGYLAPELLQGEAPSTASDLYAFAVVVQELLKRVLPSPHWRVTSVMARALNPESRVRYPSAKAFIDQLARAIRPAPWSWTWKLTLAAAVLVALVTAAFRFYLQGRPTVTVASQVLLTDMMNGTGDAGLAGAGEILRALLAQSPHFELMEPARMQAVLREMRRPAEDVTSPEVAREIAMRDGAPLVVYSAITRLASDYLLNVKLERVGASPAWTRSNWTESWSVPSQAGLPGAMHDAAVWIRSMVGETPASLDDQNRAPAETTTISWEALRLFKRATEASSQQRTQDAVLFLEQAIKFDPGFATAHARLGDHLIGLRRHTDGYAHWEKAIQLVDQKQLTNRESLRIRGQYPDETGDLSGAENAHRAYIAHYPNDVEAALRLGSVLVEQDRLGEGMPWLQKAHALRPAALAPAVHLTMAYIDAGREEEARLVVSILETNGHRDWASWLKALMVFAGGDLEGALNALEPLRTSPDLQWRSRASAVRASWLAEGGADTQAIEELRGGIALDSAQGFRNRLTDKHLLLAELQLRMGDKDASSNALRALDIGGNAIRLARAAHILVRTGQLSHAQKLLTDFDVLPQVPVVLAARHRFQAELRLGHGDAKAAADLFERGFAGVRRSHTRWPMVQALVAARDTQSAITLLEQIVRRPAAIYGGADPDAPGLMRHAAALLVELVSRRNAADAQKLRQHLAPFLRTVSSVNQSIAK